LPTWCRCFPLFSSSSGAFLLHFPLFTQCFSDRTSSFSLFSLPIPLPLRTRSNYWLISEDTCHATAPVLYKGALVALILSWLWTAEVRLTFTFSLAKLTLLFADHPLPHPRHLLPPLLPRMSFLTALGPFAPTLTHLSRFTARHAMVRSRREEERGWSAEQDGD
jgi:hypothetical protein